MATGMQCDNCWCSKAGNFTVLLANGELQTGEDLEFEAIMMECQQNGEHFFPTTQMSSV